MVLDRLAQSWGIAFRSVSRWSSELAESNSVFLCKPFTYMNLSGQAVGAICHYYKIPAERVLVVSDDTALPLGKLRLRLGGSAGGHNGLDSIIDHLRTNEFPRLRIGIGATAPQEGLTNHVLGRFSPAEVVELNPMLARAVDAIEYAQKNSAQAAMNLYNQSITT